MGQLEQRLDAFLKQENVEAVKMFEICSRMHKIDPFSLMCLDFLISDYRDFIDMMLDFKRAFHWQSEDNEQQ